MNNLEISKFFNQLYQLLWLKRRRKPELNKFHELTEAGRKTSQRILQVLHRIYRNKTFGYALVFIGLLCLGELYTLFDYDSDKGGVFRIFCGSNYIRFAAYHFIIYLLVPNKYRAVKFMLIGLTIYHLHDFLELFYDDGQDFVTETSFLAAWIGFTFFQVFRNKIRSSEAELELDNVYMLFRKGTNSSLKLFQSLNGPDVSGVCWIVNNEFYYYNVTEKKLKRKVKPNPSVIKREFAVFRTILNPDSFMNVISHHVNKRKKGGISKENCTTIACDILEDLSYPFTKTASPSRLYNIIKGSRFLIK